VSNGGGTTAASQTAATAVRRASNGLKELLAHLEGLERGQILDVGPVSQATVDFFTGRGFRLHTQDLLRSWREFLSEELNRPARAVQKVTAAAGAGGGVVTAAPEPEEEEELASRPGRFLAGHLCFAPKALDGVLLWDSLDYLDSAAGTALVGRLAEIVRPGGAVLLHLHDKPAERFCRYRVLDLQTLECVPAAAPVAFQRVLANREIMNLFHEFHGSKTFVGRDQIREVLFLR
jgi:hypothetical protein